MKDSSQPNNRALLRSELRKFGVILACGITLIFGLFFPWLGGSHIQLTHWPWGTSFVLLTISVFSPIILKPLNKFWLFIGEILGYINTRIILGAIYLMIFTPTAIGLKLLGKDPLRRAFKSTQDSYRIDSIQPKLENLKRPY